MNRAQVSWKRLSDNPFLSPAHGTLAPLAVTTPDLVILNGQLTLFVGAVTNQTERIIRVPLAASDLEGPASPSLLSASVSLDIGPLEFDCDHVFDPAVVVMGRQVSMFYSAIGRGPDRIGQAVSEDGQGFTKIDHAICPGRSPEVVCHQGKLHLFYVLKSSQAGYRIYLSIAEDLHAFQTVSTSPVLDAGPVSSWDAYEVTTPRVFEHNSTYYMIYAGGCSSDRKDQPVAFGLARSKNLIEWEKYPLNPVFEKGPGGQWDDGAIWFGTVYEWNGNLYLLYEGGRSVDLSNRSPGVTQVGLAKLPCADFDRALGRW